MPRTAEALEYVRRIAVARLDEGYDTREVAEFLGVSVRSVQRWAQVRNCRGESALAARPHPGRPPKLDDAQAATVLSWLDRRPCDFGFVTQRWTARRLAELNGMELGVRMNPRYLSDWLGRRHITPQVPKRSPCERDEGEIRWWVNDLWPRIKKKLAMPAPTSLLPTKAGF
jgi:transposase